MRLVYSDGTCWIGQARIIADPGELRTDHYFGGATDLKNTSKRRGFSVGDRGLIKS
jgi:hypothetical protein